MKAPLLVLLLALTACGHKETVPTPDAAPIKAQTVVVQPQEVPDIYEVVGTVRPRVGATVSSKVMATIEKLAVKSGDIVKAGDTLAELDDRDVRAAFERAQADFDRFKKLLDQGVATAVEFQTAEERYRVAKTALSYATIVAPYDGLVAEKLCDIGDLAVPGKALFTIEQPGDFRLEAYVPERYAAAVPVGATVHVIVEAVGGACDGVVDEVVASSEATSRSFLVKVALHPKKPLKSGMFGRAQIVVGARKGLFVTVHALRERGQLAFVYVAHDGRARMRLVKAGKIYGDKVELLSGVEAGEVVLFGWDSELDDGRRIR